MSAIEEIVTPSTLSFTSSDPSVVSESNTNLDSSIFCELNNETCVRRSNRAIGSSDLMRRDVLKLLEKINSNHSDTVVLKLKMHISSQISYTVMDAILDALLVNNVCQVSLLKKFSFLYICLFFYISFFLS